MLMKRATALTAALLLLLSCLPGLAEGTELILTALPGAAEYRFSVPGEQFAMLKYSAPRESGQTVLYGAGGDFSGVLALPCSAAGDRVKFTVLDTDLKELASGKLTLTESIAALPRENSAVRKAEGLKLTELPVGFAYEFDAPGTDYMELSYRNRQQSASFYIFPANESGHYAGIVEQPLTYARTLSKVTVLNGKGRETGKGEVRKGYLAPPAPERQEGRLSGVTVCIDPGHQENNRSLTEPRGPGLTGSATSYGGMAQGLDTLRKESIVVLEISVRLRDMLLSQGAEVVMTRETQDVYHSNIERARIAAEADADILLRVHADMVDDRNKRGFSVHAPLNSAYARQITTPKEYRQMGELLLNAMKRATGLELTEKTGTMRMGDGFVGNNWAEMICFLVETGYMSTTREDHLLSQPVYQQWLAEGMAQGVYEIAVMKGWVEAE